MKKGMNAPVGSAGKKVASGKNDMRTMTGSAVVGSTGTKGRTVSSNKQDQRFTRA